MKMLKYKPYKGLRVLCKKCRYEVHNIQASGLKTSCSHPIEYQIYKAVLFDINGRIKTRNLKSLKYDEAVKELIEFQEELNNPIPTALIKRKETERPMGLIACMTNYLDYLNGIGVPEQEKRIRNKTYLANMGMYCTYFVKFLKSKKIDVKSLRIDEITPEGIVSEYYKFVKTKTGSNSTFNDYFKPLKGLYSFLIKKRNYLIYNPFNTVPHLADSANPTSIRMEDIIKIKNAVSPVDSVEVYRSGARKNRYREWLIDAIDLGLTTGIRLEQIAVLKWSDIEFNGAEEPVFIKSVNLKANRLKNWQLTQADKIEYIPISMELKELLIRMGLGENRGKDQYLLAPFDNLNRLTVVKQMSAGFTFFRNKVGVSKSCCFENLRKTYLTHMKVLQKTGYNIRVSGHSSEAVLEKHYYDGAYIAEQTTALGYSLYKDGLNLNIS